jgi:hypothetical protein
MEMLTDFRNGCIPLEVSLQNGEFEADAIGAVRDNDAGK